jgi:hypothetical protein
MATLTLTANHKLGRAEALRRVKEKLESLLATYRSKVSDPHEEWTENSASLRFGVVGVHVSGTVTVTDSELRVTATVPFAMLVFKHKIESRVRTELDRLLA